MEVNAKRIRRNILNLTEQRRSQREALRLVSLFPFFISISLLFGSKIRNCLNFLPYSTLWCQGKRNLEFPDFLCDSLVLERNLPEKWGTHLGNFPNRPESEGESGHQATEVWSEETAEPRTEISLSNEIK